MNNYTSQEQSKKLVELGLSPESADMWYTLYGNTTYNITLPYNGEQWFLSHKRFSRRDDIPCWSVGALEDILWKRCFNTDLLIENGDKYWVCVSDGEIAYDTSSYASIIDALYDAIEWLLRNNHLK